MAVGGLFYGEDGCGLIGQFQRNEYTRYQRDLRRRRGRVFVLTGTASVFRPRALRAVAEERGQILPGVPGDVYDTIALTEDNELTIALKTLGALMISPQRVHGRHRGDAVLAQACGPSGCAGSAARWRTSAPTACAPQTFRYWAQQLGIGYGVIALAAYLLLIILMVLATSTLGVVPVLDRASAWSSPSSAS